MEMVEELREARIGEEDLEEVVDVGELGDKVPA